jgi:hypothetical protein
MDTSLLNFHFHFILIQAKPHISTFFIMSLIDEIYESIDFDAIQPGYCL